MSERRADPGPGHDLRPSVAGAGQGGGSIDVIERIAVRRNRDRPFQMAAA
jgi:hypothetical protein